VVAADGPKGLKLVVELGDGWVTLGRPAAETPDEWWRGVAELSTRLDDALARADRESSSLDRYLSLDVSPQFSLESIGVWEDAVGRAGELGFTDVVAHWPRAEGIYAGSEEVLIEAASRFSR
jgi:alkanesulfonate monooxygenase SsuD/methylene tetrahydromethanopterin reductase-like flavin-dependent oxidoreductase (luciferase family)